MPAASIPSDSRVNNAGPCIDATLHVTEVSKAVLAKILSSLLTPNPMVTLKNDRGFSITVN